MTRHTPDADFHLFLLAGQSNMAGRGYVEEQDQVPHPRVLALRENRNWGEAVEPLHYDKPSAGVGPGRVFGIAVADAQPGIQVGLIPAACGGSGIEQWKPGAYWEQTDSHPYDAAIERARRAMRDGTLRAILWHQGEADSVPGKAEHYEQRLRELIARFRKDLDAPHLPFIIGQIGQFTGAPWNEAKKQVDEAAQRIASEDPYTYFVESNGLGSLPDNLHFDAPAQREMGRRYAQVWLKVAQQ